MTPEQSVLAAILICVAGAGLTLLVSRYREVTGWLAFVATSIASAFVFSAVSQVLLGGSSSSIAVSPLLPRFGLVLRITVDGLTATFLMLAAVLAVPAALYSIAYLRHYPGHGVARYYPNFLLFVAAMYGLLSITDMMWVFFLFWQLLTLPGYALIRYEHEKPENIRAANKYLIMMEVACGAIMLGARLLVAPGSASGTQALKYDFDHVSANLPLLLQNHPGMIAIAFGLFLVGFGIKMGMWPFGQLWLPDAHPAAPSPVSAMLSGVMIKTGVYGLLRYFLWLVPASASTHYPLAKWGAVIAVLGTVTLFTGTMQALKQEQSKRLLAFHSIGQVGYILLGSGACMALLASPAPGAAAFAAVALAGALFHVLNHGLFKGLLFFNAGSMLHATGTQDLNQMGGLMKFMPLTAVTALIASFSISGVPLFNGFVSKWNIYVATIQGGEAVKYLPFCAVVAIITSALTLASFIKFFGVSFLSRTSALVKSRAAAQLRLEVPWMMQLPQVVLAFFCVLLGLVPAIGLGLIERGIAASPGGFATRLTSAQPAIGRPLAGLQGPNVSARFAPLALLAAMGLLLLLSFLISRLGSAPRRVAAPWLCGYASEAECHRYVAHNFYGEIKRYFGWLGGAPHRQTGKPAVRELT